MAPRTHSLLDVSRGHLRSNQAMPQPLLASWPRPHFQSGGGDAHLFYKIHGSFPGAPEVSGTRHRTSGVPVGCSLEQHTRDTNPGVLRFGVGDEGYIAQQLREDEPALCEAIAKTDQCLVVRGEVPDPDTLDYFRDAVGLVTALLDAGGIAVFDPHMFKWWSA